MISLLCAAYCGPGDEVLYSQHGFLMYPIAAMARGATPVKAPERNYTTDVDALLAAVTPKTKIVRSEEHTSELQSLMRISYAVFCLKKKRKTKPKNHPTITHSVKPTRNINN